MTVPELLILNPFVFPTDNKVPGVVVPIPRRPFESITKAGMVEVE